MFSTPRRRRTMLYFFSLLVVFALSLQVTEQSKTQLEKIQETGTLRIATRNSPVTYFIDHGKPNGFEFQLSQAFARFLGLKLKIVEVDNISELSDALRNHKADLASSMLTVTPERSQEFDFSPAYMSSEAVLVYRITKGEKPPKSLEDIGDKDLKVMHQSSHAEILRHYQQQHPTLNWWESQSSSDIEMLEQVHNKVLDYTVVDSISFNSHQSYFPGLKTAFSLSDSLPIAWMMTKQMDPSLHNALKQFFNRPATTELLEQLKKQSFQQKNQLNFFDTVTFKKDLKQKLPLYEAYFKKAAEQTNFSWQLLAAISYQESHWNPKAVSPTGVRGLMMLTNATAKEMGVTDRTDPEQSIIGGAHYLRKVKSKIPKRIQQPDRTWFALASYNVGYGHLEDARVLASRAGKNPDLWQDVRKFLPLLSKHEYFTTVRYGYARGGEPVRYVSNIRKYQKLLKWEQQVAQMKQSANDDTEQTEPAEPEPALNSIPSAL